MYNQTNILTENIKQLKANGIIRYDADIVRDTGVNKGVLSTYISGKAEPSKSFMKNFREVYKQSLDNIAVTSSAAKQRNIFGN